MLECIGRVLTRWNRLQLKSSRAIGISHDVSIRPVPQSRLRNQHHLSAGRGPSLIVGHGSVDTCESRAKHNFETRSRVESRNSHFGEKNVRALTEEPNALRV